MTAAGWRQLAVVSVTDPAAAARALIALRPPREALWTALVLVAVLNTLIFVLSGMLVPGPSPLPAMLSSPVIYFAIVAGGLVLTVYAIFWTGRAFGGQGAVEDILVLIVWMQSLRVLVQVAALVLVLTAPLLSALLVFAAALIGLYMLVHFIDQAHRFGSPGRAIGVLIASVLAIVLGLSVLLSLLAGPILGVSSHV
ncbi:MAG: YIP1 family protein [Sedimentitalea sp.]|nr:YIP1 family protein [Sedimentitalea sp.]